MKIALAIAMAILVSVGAVAGVYLYDQFQASPPKTSSPSSGCSDPATINSHVYNPERLQVVKSCITASGIVDNVIDEADGDVHIRLSLDPAYSNLTNSANDQYQYGDLVVEIICVNIPTQADATAPCQNYTNQIPIPIVGEHIIVTGPYVLDRAHHNWAEIHPVYSLVNPSLTTAVSVSQYVLNIRYPSGTPRSVNAKRESAYLLASLPRWTIGKNITGTIRRQHASEEKGPLPLGLPAVQAENAWARLQIRPAARIAPRKSNRPRKGRRRMPTA